MDIVQLEHLIKGNKMKEIINIEDVLRGIKTNINLNHNGDIKMKTDKPTRGKTALDIKTGEEYDSEPLEEDSPIPSIRNLPEDDDPAWLMGLNKYGGKVRTVHNKLAGNPDYLVAPTRDDTGWKAVEGYRIVWETSEEKGMTFLSGKLIQPIHTGIAKMSASFRLEPGHAYELAGWVPIELIQSTTVLTVPEIEYQWFYDGNAVGMPGSTTVPFQASKNLTTANQRPAIAIVDLSSETFSKIVELEITKVSDKSNILLHKDGYCSITALNLTT